MPEPRPEAEEELAERQELTVDERIAELLARARAARAAKQLAESHALYTEAAALGSTDADYALGVFSMVGQVVEKDSKQGMILLRRAADAGHLQARVHLANVLDSGSATGAAEPERALLFIRGAARSLGLDNLEDDHAKRALAEAGVGRFLEEQSELLSADERNRWTRRARALGYGKRGPVSETDLPPLEVAPLPAPSGANELRANDVAPAPAPRKKAAGPARASVGEAIAAAGYAALFLAAGWGLGFAATQGAKEMLEHGTALPLFGRNLFPLWPICVVLIGVLPANLFYRAGTYWRAVGVAIATGFAGFMVHGTGALVLLASRPLQGLAAGTLGFWLALLLLGLLGGAKTAQRGTL